MIHPLAGTILMRVVLMVRLLAQALKGASVICRIIRGNARVLSFEPKIVYSGVVVDSMVTAVNSVKLLRYLCM